MKKYEGIKGMETTGE